MRQFGRFSLTVLPWNNVVFRLAVYYSLVLIIFLGLGMLFPSIIEYMDLERLRVVTKAADVFGDDGQAARAAHYSTQALFSPARFVPVLVSMAGALALSVPAAWVYVWIRPYSKSKQGVARALVVLPIAIAFVVFLVKGSLPLAFSLAGIVAAVRFRTTLSDTTDAVFLFVVIGIGLSAGVQLLSVAFIASALFTVVALTVWGVRFAENPARLDGLRLVRDDAFGLTASPGGEKPLKVAEGAGERPEVVFLVTTSDPGNAGKIMDLVFGRYGKNWRLDQISDAENGLQVMKYSVQLKKRHEPAAISQAIQGFGESVIVKVESLS
jgi:hypothetical protein